MTFNRRVFNTTSCGINVRVLILSGTLGVDTAGKDVPMLTKPEVQFVTDVASAISIKMLSWNERLLQGLDELSTTSFFDGAAQS